MKCFNGQCYVEVNTRRFNIHPSKIIILGERREPKIWRFQYQTINKTHKNGMKKLLETKMKN